MSVKSPIPVMLATCAALSVFAVGCGDSVEDAVRDAGATPCSEFTQQSPEEQTDTINDFLKEEAQNDAQPNSATIDAAKYGIMVLCAVQGNGDTPIREADLNLVPTSLPPQN